jgi:hypothetical protein
VGNAKKDFSLDWLEGDKLQQPIPLPVQKSKLECVKAFLTQPIYLNTNNDPKNQPTNSESIDFREAKISRETNFDSNLKKTQRPAAIQEFESAFTKDELQSTPYWTFSKVLALIATSSVFIVGIWFTTNHFYAEYQIQKATKIIDEHFANIQTDLATATAKATAEYDREKTKAMQKSIDESLKSAEKTLEDIKKKYPELR